jgi:hypothetical protein
VDNGHLKAAVRAHNCTRSDHMTSVPTVEHDLEERSSAQRFPAFADKDEAAGSSPARPTNLPPLPAETLVAPLSSAGPTDVPHLGEVL